MSDTATQIKQAIQEVANQFYRLVILVGLPTSGKTAALTSVAKNLGCSLVNVNLELSKKLLELTRSQRSRRVDQLLKDILATVPGDVVLLDNLEILFDTSLELEPLRLLQLSSRNRTIVASWNGSYQSGTLTYAEPSHPEFARFQETDAIVIAIGSADKN